MARSNYWRIREEAQRLKNIKDEAEYAKAIDRMYEQTLYEVQQEIDAFYGKYAQKEGISLTEAKRRVSMLDMDKYSKRAERYVKDRNFSERANSEMRLYNLTMKVNRLEMLKARIGLHIIGHSDWLDKYFQGKLNDATRSEFKRLAGIMGESIKSNEKQAHAIVNGDFHSATFSERIWSSNEVLKLKLEQELQTAMIQGRRPDYAKFRQLFGATSYQAQRLLRTEMKRCRTEAAKQEYAANGFEEYEFMALGPNPCEICKALDGKHFGVRKMLPGENAAPMHPNCRCSTGPWVDTKSYEEWLDAKSDGTFNGSFKNWQNQSNEVNFAKVIWQESGEPFMPHFTPEEALAGLEKSSVGREVRTYLEKSGTVLDFVHGMQMHTHRGQERTGIIKIFVYNIANKEIATQTVVHEVTHKMYGIGGSRWAEAVCYTKEKEHLVDRKLTFGEKKSIIKKVNTAYSDLPWRKSTHG